MEVFSIWGTIALKGATGVLTQLAAIDNSARGTADYLKNGLGSGLTSLGQSMKQMGATLTRNVTLPIVAAGAAVFKMSMDFESAFAGVRKTVSATDEQFAVLRQGIRDMAQEIPVTAEELSKIMEYAGQLGIRTENLLSFTRVIADLVVATNLTSENAALSLAQFANITQMKQEDFERLGSTVVDLGNNFATLEDRIVNMMLRIAGVGNMVGLTEANIAGIGTAMASLGLNPEAGGTAISRVMANIDQAVGGGGEKMADFAKIAGLSAKEFKKAWGDDPATVLDLFVKGIGKLKAGGKDVYAILESFGLNDVRVRDTILRLAGAGDILTEAIEAANKAWEENNALSEEARKRYETMESQLKIIKNRIKDMAYTLGDALIPWVKDFVKEGGPFSEKLGEIAAKLKSMSGDEIMDIFKKLGMAAAAGPLLSALGNLTIIIGGVVKVIGALALGVAKAGVALQSPAVLAAIKGFGLVLGPVAAIATAFLLAMEGVAKYYQNHPELLPTSNAVPITPELKPVEDRYGGTGQETNTFIDNLKRVIIPPTEPLPWEESLASGGIVSSPTHAFIGESGPEAVIPLSQFGGMGGHFTMDINVTVTGGELDEARLTRVAEAGLMSLIRKGDRRLPNRAALTGTTW